MGERGRPQRRPFGQFKADLPGVREGVGGYALGEGQIHQPVIIWEGLARYLLQAEPVFIPINIHGGTHAFEEVGGMSWGEKELENRRRFDILIETLYDMERKKSPEFRNVEYARVKALLRKYMANKEAGKYQYHHLKWALDDLKGISIADRFK